ncbi:FxsA family protein [Vibrio ulleungensis]|uniref:Membrane protein FxsA n=1 Tax=Vibrio ulleungensis TaxID=2807619 RepID=A0ABS2HJQ9_9VIBR|nr:FxsA family protein [Vibrio ulleungensis]MBM7037745.1 membrane protein FxsA [Vibrio ulleungensis]
MFPILLALFIVVPIVEIALFIQVGGALGVGMTVALVVITALVGASLVRSQGLQTIMSVQNRLQQGEMPAQQIVEGVMLAVAGVLLLTPGFMTDAFGMIVLMPAPRAAIAKQLMSRVQVQASSAQFGHFEQHGQHNPGQNPFQQSDRFDSMSNGNTFEGEYERKDDEERK